MNQRPFTLLHGATDFPLTLPEETPDRNGLDKVQQTFQARRRDAYRVDTARSGGAPSRFPGYNQIFIDRARVQTEVPGAAYEFDLTGLGLLDGRDRVLPEALTQPPEDWDQVTHTVYTTDPSRYPRGAAHPDWPWMLVSEPPPKVLEIGSIWRLQVPYKGIVHSGLDSAGKPIAKSRAYRLTCNEATVAFSTVTSLGSTEIPNGFTDENGDFNGWVAKYGQVSIPKIQIVETYLNIDGPPTHKLPSCMTPEFAVQVKNIFPTALASAPVNFNWPWGWSFISATGLPLIRERINHATLTQRTPWLCTNVYEYRQQFIPK